MKELSLLVTRMGLWKHCNFYKMRTVSYFLLEPSKNIFNQCLSTNIRALHALLEGNTGFLNRLQFMTLDKKNKSKTSGAEAPKVRDGERKKSLKKTKFLTIKPEIDSHDFQTKMKQIQKFLDKEFLVGLRVDNPKGVAKAVETVLEKVQRHVTEKKMPVKLVRTGSVINFYTDNDKNSENDKNVPEKESGSS